MEKRTRSPNYPAFGLRTALEKVATLYKNQHTHGAPREVAVMSMGYSGLNGASASAISAVLKFGLLERSGEEVRISDRAMRILHPRSSEEKAEAIREAAGEPQLFRELSEKFPGRLPADEILRNHLIRSGFAPAAVSSVILAYRETIEFVEQEAGAYDSGQTQSSPPALEAPMPAPQLASAYNTAPVPPSFPGKTDRVLAHYEFESGGNVRIVMSGPVSTQKALKMAETLLKLKREELAEAPPENPASGTLEELEE